MMNSLVLNQPKTIAFLLCLFFSCQLCVMAVEEPISLAIKAENPYLANEEKEFKDILDAALGDMKYLDQLSKVKKILLHLQKIQRIESNQYYTTRERYRALNLYKDMKFNNVGYLNDAVCDLLCGMLQVYGFEFRRIRGQSIIPASPLYKDAIQKNFYRSNNTVEVKIGSQWILIDPTVMAIPKFQGKYLSLKECIDIVLNDNNAGIEWDVIDDGKSLIDNYSGYSNNFFHSLYFYNVIKYLPFNKYPFDDVFHAKIMIDGFPREVFTYKGDVVLDTYIPMLKSLAVYDKSTFCFIPPTRKEDTMSLNADNHLTRKLIFAEEEDFLNISKDEDLALIDRTLARIFPKGISKSPEDNVIQLLKFSSTGLKYQPNVGNSASKFIKDGYAICGGNAMVFISLSRRLGIPARAINVFGLTGGSHAVAEVYYEDEWHWVDPTWGVIFYSNKEYNRKGSILSIKQILDNPNVGWIMHVAQNMHNGEFTSADRDFPVTSFKEKKWTDSTDIESLYAIWLKETFPVQYGGQQVPFPLTIKLEKDKDDFIIGDEDNDNSDVVLSSSQTRNGGAFLNNKIYHVLFIDSFRYPAQAELIYSFIEQPISAQTFTVLPLKHVHIIKTFIKGKQLHVIFQLRDKLSSFGLFSNNGYSIDKIELKLLSAE